LVPALPGLDRVRDRAGTWFESPAPLPLTDACGPGGRPREVTIDVPEGTQSIRLLLAATRRAPAGRILGHVEWTTGSRPGRLELRYGVHIAGADDPTACTEATAAHEGRSLAGSALILRSLRVETGGARRLVLRAVDPAAAPALYGVACLNPPHSGKNLGKH
ncbi:MAG: hypothetical protein ACKO5K_04285, partial [Armatimonadota bacterium]